MRLVGSFVFVVCLGLTAPCYAQQSSAESDCMALPAAAQSGCLEKLANAADAKLNEVYRRAISRHRKAELKKAQQAWIVFRGMDCGALAAYEWGHGTGMGSATESCILDKTEQRTRELVSRYIERR
jgi:uncharacterized protein YecT (DUF1311 family)